MGKHNKTPTNAQREMFKRKTGVALPDYIVTAEGARVAIQAVLTAIKHSDAEEFLLPAECAATSWSEMTSEFIPIPNNKALYPFRLALGDNIILARMRSEVEGT